jgi:hypothetical protein
MPIRCRAKARDLARSLVPRVRALDDRNVEIWRVDEVAPFGPHSAISQ